MTKSLGNPRNCQFPICPPPPPPPAPISFYVSPCFTKHFPSFFRYFLCFPYCFSLFPILGLPIENFNQVRTSLTDLPYSLIFGALLNSKNYKEAVNVLEERFGDKQMLIFSYMDGFV